MNGPEDAPDPCSAHLAASRGAVAAFRAQLPDGHVLATMVDEHARILEQLDGLEATLRRGGAEPDPATLTRLHEIGAFLVGVEPHHAREEQVLFPLLRERGMHGPTAVMEYEHQELRQLKHAVRDQSLALRDQGAGSWEGLVRAGSTLVTMLRQHIDKENQVLYPMALQFVREPEVWAEARSRCDQIGYF